ncbi:hypothetical protein ACLOJK_019251 [Asimina triloba]
MSSSIPERDIVIWYLILSNREEMGYWTSQVLPKIRKIFDKSSTKKMAAEKACLDFDDLRELIHLEFEEKKKDLKHKVTQIYSASSLDTKAVLKARTKVAIKKKPTATLKFLERLVKIAIIIEHNKKINISHANSHGFSDY